jgi:SAM-dependent methyltransferase
VLKVTPLEFVSALRTEEISRVLNRHGDLFVGKDLLEIGSGAGDQLRALAAVCKSTTGLEMSNHSPAIAYDGRHIPFAAESFDTVFSSHVMEHVQDDQTLHHEMRRVLRPRGVCVHIVPSAAWRVWASILHYPALVKMLIDKLAPSNMMYAPTDGSPQAARTPGRWKARLRYALIQSRHGERGNWLIEHHLFRCSMWQQYFERLGWTVSLIEPMEIFQSGHYMFRDGLSWHLRSRLSIVMGHAAFLFILR